MSRTWTIVTILAVTVGCGGRQSLDEGGDGSAAATSSQCGHDPAVGTGQPGSCGVGAALLDCEFPNGAGCGCLSDGPACEGCTGATCTDKCNANEYAVSCGSIGPGNPSITYADPPAACRFASANPGGISSYCCPCL